eukprot:354254-Chlamydomonas_euryale.AAC.11
MRPSNPHPREAPLRLLQQQLCQSITGLSACRPLSALSFPHPKGTSLHASSNEQLQLKQSTRCSSRGTCLAACPPAQQKHAALSESELWERTQLAYACAKYCQSQSCDSGPSLGHMPA